MRSGVEAVWGEGSEVDGGAFVFEEVGHDAGRGWGEKDAVAEVAGGDEFSRRESAEERKAVRGEGAEAGPGFELGSGGCGGQHGQEFGGPGAEVGEVGGVGGGVEAGVFDGRADEGSSGLRAEGAGDDVDVLGAVDFGERRGKLDAEHLSLAGRDGVLAAKPCSVAVDEL